MCTRCQCLCHDAALPECQVAERDADQSGGGAAAGRGGLLRPLWQKAEAVPRCNEGTTAPTDPHELHCSLLTLRADTQARALRCFIKELRSNGLYIIDHRDLSRKKKPKISSSMSTLIK